MNERDRALLTAMHKELVAASAHKDAFEFAPEYVPLLADAVGRALKLSEQLAAVQQWAADNYMAWLKDKPMTAMDWDDLREALGVKRLGP